MMSDAWRGVWRDLACRPDGHSGTCAGTGSDEGCSHNDNDIARGIDLAVTNRARVVNISLGGSPPNSNLQAAIDRATAAGVIIVFSGGNQFDSDPVNAVNPDPLAIFATDPRSRGLVIIAGALDETNTSLTTFSTGQGPGRISIWGPWSQGPLHRP